MAEEPEEGVTAESPPAPETPPQAAAAAVTGSAEPQETDPEGVPWKNRVAEMERRHQRAMEDQQRMFQAQLQQFAQQFQPPAPRPAPQPAEREYTDEELLALANQGHSAAMQTLIQRQVRQQVAQQTAHQQRVGGTAAMIAQLQQRYPDFTNTASELYRHANRLYSGFIQGRDQLEAQFMAYTAAIADRPDLVSGAPTPQQRAAEGARQSNVQAHESVGGTTYARQPARRQEQGFTKAVTPQEAALAQKYGVKDPLKAKQRLMERQQSGRSSVSPGLSSAIGDI